MTTDILGRINPNAVNYVDHGMARELLYITESAVDALSLNHSQSDSANRQQKSDSSFLQAQNAEDVESASINSRSSTASEILKRSTNASAAFSIPPLDALLPHSSEVAKVVRLPVKVLREVPVPHDVRFSGSMAVLHDSSKAQVTLQRKPDDSSLGKTVMRKSDKNVSQGSKKMHSVANESATDIPRILCKPSANGVETSSRIKWNELSESSAVHPLMAILDNGNLSQPIHTIAGEEKLSSVDSHRSSMATTASPIEVIAKDSQTSWFNFFLELPIMYLSLQYFETVGWVTGRVLVL